MRALSAAGQPVSLAAQAPQQRRRQPQPAAAAAPHGQSRQQPPAPAAGAPTPLLDRRSLLSAALAAAAAAALPVEPAAAIQGITAGRIPGVTGPDADGYMTYQRPEGKSGGHGVGWTEVERYSFKVPQGWDEVPVSIADLGGTEIDMRYSNSEQGKLLVVVAPVARFKDIPFNTSVTIKDLGSPEVLISGFAPELYGEPLGEGDILDMQVVTKDRQPYYIFELSKHRLVSAAATGNRLYIMAVNAKSIQWRKHSEDLLKIRDSFTVPLKEA